MQKLYNILIIHNKYHFPGGEDTVVEQDTKLLEQHGHNVFHYYRSNDELATLSPIQKLFVPFRTIFSLKTYREIKALIKEHHIDIVHVHNTFLMTSFSAYYAAKKMKCSLIQTIHNFRLVCPNALLFRNGHICEDCLNSNLLCSVKHKCYRDSTLQSATLAVTLAVHRILHSFNKPDAYITMTEFNKLKLGHIIPSEKFYFKANYLEPETLDNTLALPSQPYFVYASRVERIKGIFTVLEAFRQLPNEHLIVIGSGPDESEVQSYIAKYHMKNVTLLGYLPHNQTVTYLADAKAMIFPSLLYEGGFPLTIIESFSVSTPVIVSDSPNISSNIKEGYNGFLFETGSSKSLLEKLKHFNKIASNPEQKQQLQEHAYQSYLDTYTADNVYQRMMEIYNAAYNHSQDTI